MLQRILIGASLGGLLASGKLPPGVGTQFIAEFLDPLSKNTKARELIAKAMYEERRANSRTERPTWEKLTPAVREKWKRSAGIALETMLKMFRAMVDEIGRK